MRETPCFDARLIRPAREPFKYEFAFAERAPLSHYRKIFSREANDDGGTKAQVLGLGL
jgi:hypothetical protein